MQSEMAEKLRRSLIKHEGYKRFPYTDTVGKTSIGIGYDISDRGLSDEWINHQYQSDVDYFYSQLLHTFKWFAELNIDRQIALCDMAFMGLKRLMGFEKMLAALAQGDYKRAADEMLASEWAQQVKGRATELADAIRSGVYNV